MNKPQAPASGPWVRPEPERLGPRRGFGGYYRSADREVDGKTLRGVPLQAAEDAAVAAVRMAYRIADGQIDRGMRIARDLRGAASRQGTSAETALDASERLLAKALLAALQWFDGLADGETHPLRRLAAAEYRLLGAMLGLRPQREGRAARRDPAGEESAADADSSAGVADAADDVHAAARSMSAPTAPGAMAQPRSPEVVLKNAASPEKRRPIRSIVVTMHAPAPEGGEAALHFHHSEDDGKGTLEPMPAHWHWCGAGQARLELESTTAHRPGVWLAGLYDDDIQLGIVRVEL